MIKYSIVQDPKKIEIPKFKNEDKERDFWSKVDLSKHFDSSDFVQASFPKLQSTSQENV